MTAIFALLPILLWPDMASSCIITDNPCDCQERDSLACIPFGTHWVFVFLLTYGIGIIFLLFLLAGFYWTVRDKTIRKRAFLLALKVGFSFAGAFLAFGIINSGFAVFLTVFLLLNGFLLWLWRKKIMWWKALITLVLMDAVGYVFLIIWLLGAGAAYDIIADVRFSIASLSPPAIDFSDYTEIPIRRSEFKEPVGLLLHFNVDTPSSELIGIKIHLENAYPDGGGDAIDCLREPINGRPLGTVGGMDEHELAKGKTAVTFYCVPHDKYMARWEHNPGPNYDDKVCFRNYRAGSNDGGFIADLQPTKFIPQKDGSEQPTASCKMEVTLLSKMYNPNDGPSTVRWTEGPDITTLFLKQTGDKHLLNDCGFWHKTIAQYTPAILEQAHFEEFIPYAQGADNYYGPDRTRLCFRSASGMELNYPPFSLEMVSRDTTISKYIRTIPESEQKKLDAIAQQLVANPSWGVVIKAFDPVVGENDMGRSCAVHYYFASKGVNAGHICARDTAINSEPNRNVNVVDINLVPQWDSLPGNAMACFDKVYCINFPP